MEAEPKQFHPFTVLNRETGKPVARVILWNPKFGRMSDGSAAMSAVYHLLKGASRDSLKIERSGTLLSFSLPEGNSFECPDWEEDGLRFWIDRDFVPAE
jgi:hypothetical protein